MKYLIKKQMCVKVKKVTIYGGGLYVSNWR